MRNERQAHQALAAQAALRAKPNNYRATLAKAGARAGKRYGQATGADLERFIDVGAWNVTDEVRQLVVGTFGSYEAAQSC